MKLLRILMRGGWFKNSKFLLTPISTFLLFLSSTFPLLAEGVTIKNYGHSSLFIKGGGKSILLNPFKAIGCAEGLREPKVDADIILASSLLADEGSKNGRGLFFVEPGSYQIDGFRFEGVSAPHDLLGGRRYGFSTLWQWKQNGIQFAHLGGAKSELSFEHKVILGKPDVLIIAVGGGDKVYNAQEAAKVINDLSPKLIVPVQYQKDLLSRNCELEGIDPFLSVMKGAQVIRTRKEYSLSNIDKKIKELTILLMN